MAMHTQVVFLFDDYCLDMLLPPSKLRQYFGVAPVGVLHVGAHHGEELIGYRKASFGKVVWVEAQPELVAQLRQRVEPEGDVVIQACAWSISGLKKTLHITNNGESSSLYTLGTHETHHPAIKIVEEVEMSTSALSDVIPKDSVFDFINIDIQGAELEALKGLGHRLDSVTWVYLEVNREQLYNGIPQVGEISEWLRKNGFARAVALWTPYNWGDALFVRTDRGSNRARVLRAVGALRALVWFHGFPVRKLVKRIRQGHQVRSRKM